jgi:uncharacterized LabA/DUF88 family protein
LSEERLKIAVFIDFDNIEIGVKTTLGQHFDVGSVLESIKERGEIVSKSAYGDWTRAGDYGRAMSQNAIHMVQRNLTPGGDKNGADINLALDALEMAFTHSHINTFVIVGGDSDFISLVEKLKQYDRKVFVVGGRQFTSVVMQKNCTEFLAYENLVGRGRPAPRGTRVTGGDLGQAMPLVRRALKLLADREVLPQLGLLKSTLLQLDSAFSERDYGASSFRDFVQKLANAGHVTVKGTDRSFHVELRDGGDGPGALATVPERPETTRTGGHHRAAAPAAPPPEVEAAGDATAEAEEPAAAAPEATARHEPAEAVQVFQHAIAQAKVPPRWPLYVRQVKQLVKAIDPQFDERLYGFAGIVDALRFAQREGLFRIERDRLGVVRVFPGATMPKAAGDGGVEPAPVPELPATGATGGTLDLIEPAGIAIGESPVAATASRRETIPLPTRYVQVTGASDRDSDADTAAPDPDVTPHAELATGVPAEVASPATGDDAAPQEEPLRSGADAAADASPAADAADAAAGVTAPEREEARVLPRRRRATTGQAAARTADRKSTGTRRKPAAAPDAAAPRSRSRAGRTTKRGGNSGS